MQPIQRILVVGGNGFIGSAVCKAALARGMQVTSVSSSGKPYRTAKGHIPAWTTKVDWQKGDALRPETFSHLFPRVGGVVHTIGTLIENTQYKQALKDGNISKLLGTILQTVAPQCSQDPLGTRGETGKESYEVMNRDTALRVCEALIQSTPDESVANNVPRPFVYVSAEDIFRPIFPARYIETKWETEKSIEAMLHDNPRYRGVYIRPSLVYHAHHRPLTTPAAVLLDLSSTIHAKVPQSLPTPSSILRSLGSAFPPGDMSGNIKTSPLDAIANALVIPPIHVDHVAEAICIAVNTENDVRGVINVAKMRELIGWTEKDRKAAVGLGV